MDKYTIYFAIFFMDLSVNGVINDNITTSIDIFQNAASHKIQTLNNLKDNFYNVNPFLLLFCDNMITIVSCPWLRPIEAVSNSLNADFVDLIEIQYINNILFHNTVSMPEKLPLVKGKIIFDRNTKPFSEAMVFIRLQDVSRQDAPSKLISEQVLTNVSYEATKAEGVKFMLYGDIPNERSRYSINVHVDVDGDGKMSSGDLINMQDYPVLTYGNPDNVSIYVREIK